MEVVLLGTFNKQYKDMLRDLLDNGISTENDKVRTVYADGSKAWTKYLFHKTLKISTAEDDIPMLTLRKMPWKTATREMLAFWVNQTNKAKDFEELKMLNFWNEWILKDDVNGLNDTIGKSYAYNHESRENTQYKTVLIKTRVESDEYINSLKGKIEKLIHASKNGYPLYQTEAYLIEKYGDYESIKNIDMKHILKFKALWEQMMHSVFNGELLVSEDFMCFETFLRQIRRCPQFFLAKEDGFADWTIIQDYYLGKVLSKDTAVFMHANMLNKHEHETKQNSHLKCISTGEIFYSAEAFMISRYGAGSHINGKVDFLKALIRNGMDLTGYDLELYTPPEGYVVRYKLSKNQVVNLINEIKTNPTNRRLMVNYFNWANQDEKSLVECCYSWHFNVNTTSGTLNMSSLIR
jgi:thymidylate synthase